MDLKNYLGQLKQNLHLPLLEMNPTEVTLSFIDEIAKTQEIIGGYEENLNEVMQQRLVNQVNGKNKRRKNKKKYKNKM